MISDDLREAIKASGLSPYQIAKRAAENGVSIDHKGIARFLDGDRDMTLCKLMDPICDVLGLALVKRGETMPADYDARQLQEASDLARDLAKIVDTLKRKHG